MKLVAYFLFMAVVWAGKALNSEPSDSEDVSCTTVVFNGCENTSQKGLMGVNFRLIYQGQDPWTCDGAPVYGAEPRSTAGLFTMDVMDGDRFLPKQWLVGPRKCMPNEPWLIRSVPNNNTYTIDPSTSDPGLWQCWDESEGEGKWVNGLTVTCVRE